MNPSKSNSLFMVFFDDDQGLCTPMTRDKDCDGALCCIAKGETVALFSSRKDARTAIDISAKWAALRRAQGKTENTDFIEGKPCLRVVACEV